MDDIKAAREAKWESKRKHDAVVIENLLAEKKHLLAEKKAKRERNAEARSQVVDHGTATWWDLKAEMWEANAESWDAWAESYDADAKMSYVSVQAAKKRAETTGELMVEWNDNR